MEQELTSLRLKTTFRSDTDSLLRDFYVPALSRARLYQRSVAYFTSGSLAHAARGVSALIDNGGRLELIASPVLTEEDIEAINQGYASRETTIREILSSRFSLDAGSLVKKRLEALAWLVAERRLEVKIAFRIDGYGRIQRGIYHEKIGVIHDRANNFIAFGGSANESEGGLVTNFESVPVFWSWEDVQGRAKEIAENFTRLWANQTKGVRVMPFTDLASDLLQQYRPSRRPTPAEEIEAEVDADIIVPPSMVRDSDSLTLPTHITLRDYQCDVIKAWLNNNGRGIYSLATGTGKTITALATATRLRVAHRLEALLVLCPYQNLVLQWCEELRTFGANPIEAFRSRVLWHPQLVGELARPRGPDDALLTVVTTFATFGTPAFQDLLTSFPRRSMLIADEAHHVGAASLYQLLPDQGFPLRLALSATPERWQDEDGTDRILSWFGKILEPQIRVPDAISMGALCPYYYTPLFIELDELENQRYQELTRKIAALLSQGHTFATSPQLSQLLHERSSFIATVKGKTDALRTLIRKENNVSRTLVYCGAGSVEVDDSTNMVRHVDHIVDVLGNELGVRVAKYTAETPIAERTKIIQQLVNNDLQAVVAINCLDEGVDIPCIETAIILSSSTNPRQFVQRRGRVLRTFPGKEHARLFDTVVIPSGDESPTEGEKALMQRELSRYLEFARAAINGVDAERQILPLQDRFGLLHL